MGELSRCCKLLGHYDIRRYSHKIRRAPDGRSVRHLRNVLEEVFTFVFEWVDGGEAQGS